MQALEGRSAQWPCAYWCKYLHSYCHLVTSPSSGAEGASEVPSFQVTVGKATTLSSSSSYLLDAGAFSTCSKMQLMSLQIRLVCLPLLDF